MNSDWLEQEDLKFVLQIQNFGGKIGDLATTLGITTDEVSGIQKDAAFVGFVILRKPQADDYKLDWTKLKDQVRFGIGGNVLGPFPAPVDVTTPPTAVEPGVEARFRAIVKKVKASPNYTKGIGETLGIEAPATTGPGTAKPTFKIFMDSGHPVLKWVKAGYQGVEIWVDRNDTKGWVKLERDFHSPFVDKGTLPATGTSAVWKYKMIYILKDETTGDWSAEVTVTVYGSV